MTRNQVLLRILLWVVVIAIAFLFFVCSNGCFTSVDAIKRQDYKMWDAEDCMALIMANTHHNLRADGTLIYSIVTPFTPDVVRAIGRFRQIKNNISDSLTYEFVQRLTKDGTGTFVDREGVLWTAGGNKFRGDRDSLLVMVSLVNKTSPCNPPTIGGVPLMRMSDINCATPDITHLEDHIYLRTETLEILHPKFIYGRRNDSLTDDENLLVMFDLRGRPSGEVYYFVIDAFITENGKETVYPL